MASVVEQPAYWRALKVANQSLNEGSLQAMGFDVKRLGFYAWLVAHGREPQLEPGARLSAARHSNRVGGHQTS